MKIALYIEDGLEQLVLTPDSDHERNLLENVHRGDRKLSIERGGFYECRGGFVRQSVDDRSTIVVLRKAEAA